jgi:large subunit ribosomal protein L5
MEAATEQQRATEQQKQAAPPPRLRDRYEQEIKPELIKRFGYSSPMAVPTLEKITLNMGVGEAKQNTQMLEAATEQLATIAGQLPSVRKAKKSVASFKVREGMPVGVAVTLRRARMWEFLDRLTSVAVPRIRDFRGLSARSFDGRGNYSMGIREQIIFPEIDYDSIDEVRGLDVTITTTAKTDEEAFALLDALGMPFSPEGRPGEEDAEAEAEEERRKEEARERAEAEAAALEQLKEENPEAYEKPVRAEEEEEGEEGAEAPEGGRAPEGAEAREGEKKPEKKPEKTDDSAQGGEGQGD